MVLSHFVVKHFILGFWRVSCHLAPVNAFLDYLNNLQIDQCSWVTFTVLNYFIPRWCTTENIIQ